MAQDLAVKLGKVNILARKEQFSGNLETAAAWARASRNRLHRNLGGPVFNLSSFECGSRIKPFEH